MKRDKPPAPELTSAPGETVTSDRPVEASATAPGADTRARRELEREIIGAAGEGQGAKLQQASYGRYELIGELGAGGMGVVYEAYDPELDRRVALKVIGQSQRRLGSIARERQVREARALARLAHPNVIAIHDVGSVGDEVFVAMELVHGVTLKEWLRTSERDLDDILEVFNQAGRGLVAAHAVGLVHRDFKPSNVIVGDDGRVRVLDFGLARLADLEASADAVDRGAGPLGVLTGTGAVVGTPAYMAPEQWTGAKVDERSDQFSFCGALYEGLYGELPFTVASAEERVEEIVAGGLEPPATDRGIPERVRAAVVRGLAAAPDDRHPSLQALLTELARRPRAGHRRKVLLAGVAALLAVVIVVASLLFMSQPGADRAGGAAAPVANPSRLRMQMVDSASPLMAELGAYVADDAEARRRGIKASRLWWKNESGAKSVEHFLAAADRATLEDYLRELRQRRGDLAEPGHEILLGADGDEWRTYYAWTRVELDAASIDEATVQHDNLGALVVKVSFSADGAARFAATTGQNVGRRMATVVDGVVRSAVIIQGQILGGVVFVTMGDEDGNQAEAAAELAGALTQRR